MHSLEFYKCLKKNEYQLVLKYSKKKIKKRRAGNLSWFILGGWFCLNTKTRKDLIFTYNSIEHWISGLPHVRINSKLIEDINVRGKTIKLLEGEISINICEFKLGNDFLNMTSKHRQSRIKYKLDIFKLKKVCFTGHSQESEKMTHRERIYLQIMYLIRV